jgi:hypothetical protein
MLRRLAQALIVLGWLGFIGPVCLPYAGTWMDRVELPAFFETTTIALPDGGRLTATMPTGRVQRYGSDGRFQTGWFVDAWGGHFAIGLTADGVVAVCTARGRRIFLFDLDGQLLDQGACDHLPGNVGGPPGILQPTSSPVSDVSLQSVVPAGRPDASLAAVLLVPLWHPLVPWAIFVIGCFMLAFRRFRASLPPV